VADDAANIRPTLGFKQQLLRSGLISLRPFRVLLSGLTLLLSLEPLKTATIARTLIAARAA